MANNRVRCLIVTIITILLVILIIGAVIYLIRRNQHRIIFDESCPRPKEYSTDYDYDYTKALKDFQNTNSSTDYFRLSLSWSPAFCNGNRRAANSFQCQHNFNYIVHGLWPSAKRNINQTRSIRIHPRNCRNEQPMSIDTIRKYFCLMPSESLMQAEWEKHGTCYWNTPEDYFERINNIYSKISLPKNTHEILSNQTLTKRQRRQSIIQSFLDINPQLTSDNIEVTMIHKGKDLKEVAFCYDYSFNHTKCL
ncbi:hypothetical protein I4U23_024708 [Adineta vaga]|nr:hypothetical protein I4U23_024708 [Adineta vaga]